MKQHDKQTLIYLVYFFIFLCFGSCKTSQSQHANDKISPAAQLDFHDIYWGKCMRYNESFSDSNIVITYGKNRFRFDGPVYVDFGCNDTILSRSNEPMNGTYRIVSINESWNDFSPYSMIASFKNGKREGTWKYYRFADFYATSHPEIIRALPGNKNYKAAEMPVKIEVYENGLPNGVWWQRSKNSIRYFTYDKGKLINEHTDFIVNNKTK